MDCSVCCNTLGQKKVTCKYCEYTTCYSCATKYLLETSIQTKCMNCSKVFSRKDLVDTFGNYFVTNRLKKRRENVLFGLETSLLPATQERASHILQIRGLKKQIAQLYDEVDRIKCEIGDLSTEYYDDIYWASRKEIHMRVCSKEYDITVLQDRMNQFAALVNINRGYSRGLATSTSLMIKCIGAECRGFIDCKKGRCELCNTHICRTCHEVLTDEHQCNKATVESVKLIMNDTKNCPKCKSLIHKINGCDQMFCTLCQTPFSWRTGEIVRSGALHNPHYYEYLRRTGGVARELEDIPCGGIPPYREVVRRLSFVVNPPFAVGTIMEAHRVVQHVEHVEIPRFRTRDAIDNLDLRTDYLTNDITLEDFKKEIYKREKAREKKREIQGILVTLVTVCTDIFGDTNYDDIHTKLETIRTITNIACVDVSRVYKCVVPYIDHNWAFINNWK
jgi:hypothetical protein